MRFSPSKLSMAVFLATTSLAYAQENTVNLDVVSVVSENAGAKSRTNVVTLKG